MVLASFGTERSNRAPPVVVSREDGEVAEGGSTGGVDTLPRVVTTAGGEEGAIGGVHVVRDRHCDGASGTVVGLRGCPGFDCALTAGSEADARDGGLVECRHGRNEKNSEMTESGLQKVICM